MLGGVVLLVWLVLGVIPPVVTTLGGTVFNRPVPEWTYAIPLIALVALALYFLASMKMIPPRPPSG